MSNNKLNKIYFWKNFISFWVFILIISCILLFNIKIGFTIFVVINFYFNLILVLSILSIIIVVLIIVFVILRIFYNSIKIKLKIEEI